MKQSETVRPSIATWYRVTNSTYSPSIDPVAIVAFTDKTVTFFNGHREERNNLISDYYEYYPTWQQAHGALVSKWMRRVSNAEERLNEARHKLAKIQTMAQPEAA